MNIRSFYTSHRFSGRSLAFLCIVICAPMHIAHAFQSSTTVRAPLGNGFAAVGTGQDTSSDESPSQFVVSPEARRIHEQGFVWDGHNDLPWAIRTTSGRRFAEIDIAKPQPDLHTDIPRLKEGNVGAQFWSVFVPVSTIAAGTAFRTTVEQIELVHEMVETYPDAFALATNSSEIERAIADGKIASLIGMEGGHSIENSLAKLQQLYELGARYMTLTHADTLDWVDAATDDAEHGGLNAFGVEVVHTMNRIGMLVDISHVSPDTMQDVLDHSKAPIIFSHSSAKNVADHPRNVPDDILRQLPENGGIVMVNFFSGFVEPDAARILQEMFDIRRELEQKYPDDDESFRRQYRRWQAEHPYPAGDANTVVDHIVHIANVAGIDHVGIGSDYDGVGKLPVGLEDVSTYPVLTQLLMDRGYTAEDIHKIMSGNMMRVLKAAESVSIRLQSTEKN